VNHRARKPPKWHDHLNTSVVRVGRLGHALAFGVSDLAIAAGDRAVAVSARLNRAILDIGDTCVVVAQLAQGVGQLIASTTDTMSAAIRAAGRYAEGGRLRVVDPKEP